MIGVVDTSRTKVSGLFEDMHFETEREMDGRRRCREAFQGIRAVRPAADDGKARWFHISPRDGSWHSAPVDPPPCPVADCTRKVCTGQTHEKHAYHMDLLQDMKFSAKAKFPVNEVLDIARRACPILRRSEQRFHLRAVINYHDDAAHDKC